MNEFLRKRLDHINAGRPEIPKVKKPLNKVSPKRAAKIAAEKEERGDNDTEMVKWFRGRMKHMTGRCIRCGEKHDTKTYAFAICSIAHILPKRDNQFSSVKYHPSNWIELGANCGCHGWLDNFASWEEIAQDKIWPLVLERFLMIEPNLSPEDRKRLPEVLSQEIKPAF